jgi:hypothetical protein
MHPRRTLNVLSIALCFGAFPMCILHAQNATSMKPAGVDPAGVDPDVLTRTDVTEEAAQTASELFFTYYYLAPSPDRFVHEFRETARLLDFQVDANLPALSAFYGMVIRANPESTDAWVEALADLPASYRPVLYHSLRLAATKQATDALRQLADKAKGDQQRAIFRILSLPEQDLAVMPIKKGAHLDMLWGAFFATGDQRYVERVIQSLGGKTGDSLVLAGAARWSLKSNAWQHSKVLGICRAAAATAAAPVADELRAIVEEVDDILKTQPCPEPAAKPR